MPPAAISRSSTYFPKICGNIAPVHRSAFGAAWLSAAFGLGCSAGAPAPNDVRIVAHELPGCPLPEQGPAAASSFQLTLTALGPFQPTTLDVEELNVDDADHPLAFNPATVGVDAVASDTKLTFIGHSERRRAGAIDVLLWPEGQACSLAPPSEGGFPGPNAGHAWGFDPRSGIALVAGENAADERSESTVVFDAHTGTASEVTRDQGALSTYRAFASVTPFGDGLLVAGGTSPFPPAATNGDPSGTADVFSQEDGGFSGEPLTLSFRRAHHAAVTLPSTGETLLVGGLAPEADGRPGQVIRQLEAVSPRTRRSSFAGLGSLFIGRVSPVALVLGDGRVFVGGGYAPGEDEPEGAPVGQVEWFSPTAGSDEHVYAELPARRSRAFAPLPGGGVLSVASCSGEAEAKREDCTCATATGGACGDDEAAPWVDAFWIGRDEVPRPVAFVQGAALCPTPKEPLLAPGSDGAPWLVSALDGGASACLWRFEAWPEDPSAGADDPTSAPRFVSTSRRLEPAPDARAPLLSLAPDTFLWGSASGDGGLFGVALGHRGPLTSEGVVIAGASGSSQNGGLLEARDGAPYRPAHLVPERDLRSETAGDGEPAVTYSRGPARLTLRPVEPPLALWVSDTLYDDAVLTLELDPDDEPSAPPRLVVAADASPELATCSWSLASAAERTTLTAARDGTSLTLSAPGSSDTTCSVPAGRVSFGIRAADAPARLRALRIERR